jgi:hypothetical protein
MRDAVMAALFCMPSLIESMTRGQTGVTGIFLAIAVLYLYIRGLTIWTGILFGFSVVLKASPLAPVIVLFLVKREWRTVISAMLSIFFFVWIFPSIVMGADRNLSLLTYWHNVLTEAAHNPGHRNLVWSELATPLSWDNQSLYAVLTRWTRPTETALAAHGDLWTRWGVRLFGAIALFFLAFVARRGREGLSQKRIMLEYSLFLVLMLLVSPVSETHHYTTLFVLFFPVFLYLDELPRNSISYQLLMWGSLIAGLTQILGYIPPLGLWGLPMIGALLFWCVSFALLVRKGEIRKEEIWLGR